MANFGELKRQVLLRFPAPDGRTVLAVEQAINDAHRLIASVNDFDELIVLDTTNAFTIISQKFYDLEIDLHLTRPKDVYSIRYMDESSSRKLTFVPTVDLDKNIPYTELSGIGRPSHYTTRGKIVELFRIPDAVKPLYIQYSQWPVVLVDDTDESSYTTLDPAIVTLSIDMAVAIIEGSGVSNWYSVAQKLLGLTIAESEVTPDETYIARPFNPSKSNYVGTPWDDPFCQGGSN